MGFWHLYGSSNKTRILTGFPQIRPGSGPDPNPKDPDPGGQKTTDPAPYILSLLIFYPVHPTEATYEKLAESVGMVAANIRPSGYKRRRDSLNNEQVAVGRKGKRSHGGASGGGGDEDNSGGGIYYRDHGSYGGDHGGSRSNRAGGQGGSGGGGYSTGGDGSRRGSSRGGGGRTYGGGSGSRGGRRF
jgi:hypothetical protein